MSHQTYKDGTDPKSIPWDTPYKTPPPGQVSNFDHPDVHLRNTIIITSAVTLAVAFTTFVARISTRIFVTRLVGWDDYLCVAAVGVVIAFNVASLERVQYGLGIPTWDIRIVEYFERLQTPFIYWFATMNVLRHFGLMFLKLSILALYLRIMGDARDLHRRTRFIVFGAMIWVVGYNMGLLGWLLGLCDPPKKFWFPNEPGHCIYPSVWKELSAWSALNVFTDFLIFVIPLPMIYHLQMPLSQKIATMFTLATALLVCAATTVCLVISVRIIKQQSTEDPLQLWAIIEMNLGLLCICLPALKQLLSRSLPLLSKYSWSSRSYGSLGRKKASNDESSANGESKRSGEHTREHADPSASNIRLTHEMKQFDEPHEAVPGETAGNYGLTSHGLQFQDVGERDTFNAMKDTELGMSTFVHTK